VSQTTDGKLNIVGVFDTIRGPQAPVAHPLLYVVSSVEADVSAGFDHAAQLKIVDADGSEILASPVLPVRFTKPPSRGMPMRTSFIAQLAGVVFPRFGDYAVTLWLNGVAQESVTLYVRQLGAA
jgi:hypothetical protein